jgi:hypothetical protein
MDNTQEIKKSLKEAEKAFKSGTGTEYWSTLSRIAGLVGYNTGEEEEAITDKIDARIRGEA